MANIDIVLLDADGVIQTVASHFRKKLDNISGNALKSDALLEEFWTAEYPCLTGDGDFTARLDDVLSRWGNRVSRTEALAVWTAIEPNQKVLDLVALIRERGTPVVVTSSQETFRANYMAEELDYKSRFDRLFFSCDIGYMKPDVNYFTKVLGEFSIAPGRALFVDDNKNIVKGAEECGLIARQFDLNVEPVEKLSGIFSAQGLL